MNAAAILTLIGELYEQIGALREQNQQLTTQLKTAIEQAQGAKHE